MSKIQNIKETKVSDEILRELEKLRHENRLLKNLLKRSTTPPVTGKGNLSAEDFSFGLLPGNKFSSFDKISILMWVKDIEGKYINVNEEFAQAHGIDKQEFEGLTDFDVYPQVFAEKFFSDDKNVLKTGEPFIVEEMIPLREGFIWFETVKIPIYENGQITGLTALAKDISGRKQYEKALKESEEKFRELAENTTDAFVLRSGKKIIYINPAFEQVYGYSRKEVMDNPDLYRELVHPDDRERIYNVLNSEEYRSTFIFNEQYRILKKDGSVSWIWNRSFPVWNDKGEVYRIVSVVADISEIKNLEENIRKSQSQLQAILNNIPHLAWLKSTDGKYISVNQSFARHFKMEPSQIIGKTDFDLCPTKLAEDYLRKDMLVLNTRQPRQFYEVEKKNTEKRYSETNKAPVLNDKGEVIGITGISRDITDQKLAEKALIRSEEKFKDLVTLLPEVVFETDERGYITFANLKGFELMEYTHSDLIKGKSIFDLTAPEDVNRVKEIFKSFRYGSELKGKEFKVKTKSGKIIPVLIFTNNMYHDNTWAGIRGVMVDISRRKQAENQERVYQSKLLYLSDTALDFLSMNHESNLYKFIGSRLNEMLEDVYIIINRYDEKEGKMVLEYHSFSLEQEQAINKAIKISPSDFIIDTSEDQINHYYQNADHLYEFRKGFHETTFGRIPVKISEMLKEELKIYGFYGMSLMRGGKLFGSVLILSLTEKLRDKHFIETFIYQSSIALHRKQLEIELIEARKMAEESDRLKTSFLANMSHEIRTPMNGILGLAEMLTNQKVKPAKAKEYLTMISANGKLLLNLVNDIIDISKIEAKQVDLFENQFSLKELLDEVYCIISAERMVKGKENLELVSNLNIGNNENNVISDQSKLKQILINLIGNAVKFTQEGSVEFGCKLKDNKELLFYVKDTGIGIPEDKKDVIFNRFTQADQSMTRSFAGSGLGLAISKGFVELMNGKIWAESEVGKGSEFYFTIPYKPVTLRKVMKQKRKKEISDFNWKNLNILIVEDNLVSYKLLEISLSKTGCNILHAENGMDAIEMVKNHPELHIILMDIQLPVMNGYDATREIKKINSNIPVIAQTANAMDSDRMKCLEAGCSDYVTKPIVLENLMPVIETYVKAENE
jgi:PAS domain S-box-containing protein